MKPKLLLLTGPAAGEAARVLRAGIAATEWVNDPSEGRFNRPSPWWDEVRDYWEAPCVITHGDLWHWKNPRCKACEEPLPCTCCREEIERLCGYPGGEAWLVGLVLPDLPRVTDYHPWPGLACDNHPARLAILAPEPPALLVERVRAWGGDCWHLRSYDDGWCYITFEDGGSIRQMSWPEAVRAALGETHVRS